MDTLPRRDSASVTELPPVSPERIGVVCPYRKTRQKESVWLAQVVFTGEHLSRNLGKV